MNKLLIFIILGFSLISCVQPTERSKTESDEKEKVTSLIIDMMKWRDNEENFSGISPIFDYDSGLAVGMDHYVLENELKKLRQTDMFDDEFIENYKNYVLKIDSGIKSKRLIFSENDLYPYAGENPWCMCQDIPYEDPWDKLSFRFINIDDNNTELTWTWGESDWSSHFSYRVKATKKNSKWRISYLEGFDLQKAP